MKKLLEKVLSSDLVFKGNYLHIWRDQVELSTGHKSFREYIKHPGAACIVPLIDDKTVLMIHQYRHAVGKTFLEFPAGKTDKGETSLQAAHRELSEEVGMKAKKMELLTHIHPVIGYSNEQIDLFLAEDMTAVPTNADADEILEIQRVSIKDLQAKIWNHEITDVKTQIAAFWLFKKLKI